MPSLRQTLFTVLDPGNPRIPVMVIRRIFTRWIHPGSFHPVIVLIIGSSIELHLHGIHIDFGIVTKRQTNGGCRIPAAITAAITPCAAQSRRLCVLPARIELLIACRIRLDRGILPSRILVIVVPAVERKAIHGIRTCFHFLFPIYFILKCTCRRFKSRNGQLHFISIPVFRLICWRRIRLLTLIVPVRLSITLVSTIRIRRIIAEMYNIFRHFQIIFHCIDVLCPSGIECGIRAHLLLAVREIKFLSCRARCIGVPAAERIAFAGGICRFFYLTVQRGACRCAVLPRPHQKRRYSAAALTVECHPAHIIGP